jgi:hypothetical protein
VPEVSTISNAIQIGAETTPGTGVAAGKLLNYLSLAPGIDLSFNRYRPMGQKFAGALVPGKDATSWAVTGQGSYSELIYPFCSALVNVTPSTVDTTAKLWTFTPAARTEDTVKTYTVEVGSATRAQKAAYVLFTGVELTFNRTDGVGIGGDAFGQQIQDNIALTGSPTGVEDVPILPTHLDVYVDATSGALGTTKLTRDFNAVFRCQNRFNQVWPINSTLASYGSHVEVEPTAQVELTVEADTQGMTYLTNARAGSTVFIRLAAVSTVLAGAATAKYQLIIDVAAKVSAINAFDDSDGVKVLTFTFDAVYDTTWAKAFTIGLQNKTAAL